MEEVTKQAEAIIEQVRAGLLSINQGAVYLMQLLVAWQREKNVEIKNLQDRILALEAWRFGQGEGES